MVWDGREELLTPDQAGRILGKNGKWVLRAIHSGQLEAVKFGRSWRITRSGLASAGLAAAKSTTQNNTTKADR